MYKFKVLCKPRLQAKTQDTIRPISFNISYSKETEYGVRRMASHSRIRHINPPKYLKTCICADKKLFI